MPTEHGTNQTLLKVGVAWADITCEPGGTYDELLPDTAKKHIPREYLGTRLVLDDPLLAPEWEELFYGAVRALFEELREKR